MFNERLAVETEDKTLDPDVLRRGVRQALVDVRRARYFVAEIGERVVGQLMLTMEWSDWRNGDIWWLQSVYVHADHRRTGIFRRLLEHVREEARLDPSVVGLRLYVEDGNEVARRTYGELGFRPGGYSVMEDLFSK